MSTERNEELAALDALGLLGDGERREFLEAQAADPKLSQLSHELKETAAALAHTADPSTPPPELRARLLAEISGGSAAPARAANAAPAVVPFPEWRTWVAVGSLAAAAGLAVVAAWLGKSYLAARTANEGLKQEAALADAAMESERHRLEAEHILSTQELAETRQQLADNSARLDAVNRRLKAEADLDQVKIAALTSLLGNSPQALAIAVWDPQGQRGVLKVSGMPVAAADKDYQLWLIDPQYQTPVSAGIFRIDPQTGEARIPFTAGLPITTAQKFAVSLERRGGARQKEGPIVLVSQ